MADNKSVTDALKGMIGADGPIGAAAATNPVTAALYAAYKIAAPILKARNEQKQREAQAGEYDAYSNDIKGERLQGRNQMFDFYNTGNQNFEREAGTALPELTQAKADILSKGTEAQQEASRNANAQNAIHGVRGGQAVTGVNRATGKITTDMMRDINQMALGEAQNRQNSRLGYYEKQAMLPYQSLTNLDWWRPGYQEAAAKNNAIATRYA